MNNDPNNMNNGPIESLEPLVPEQPAPPQPAPAPAPVVPEQEPQRQMGTNPHQHVDLNSLTPRTVFDTSVESKKEEAPKVSEKATAPKEKSTAVPLILFLLVIAAGGYFLYTQFSPKPSDSVYELPQEEKEEKKEEKEKTEETEEGKEKTEEEKPAETPASESTPAAEQPAATTSPEETPAAVENDTPTSGGEKEFISGEILYLYFNGAIGSNGVMFRYKSHTSSQIVVEVEIDGNKKEYTITPGKQTKIDNIKNPIVMTIEDEYIAINFK